jgi:hypothetical protein
MVSKADYKLLFGKSPDLADSGVMLLEVARRKGFRLTAVGQTVHRGADWDKIVAKTREVYDTNNQYAEEEVVYEDAVV